MDKKTFDIKARQLLSENDLTEIKALQDTCNESDGLRLKLNWDMLVDRKADVTDDFLCFDSNGRLAGYLAIYCIRKSEAEISGMVHPSYRRKGIFSQLLKKAAAELRRRAVESLLLINDRNSLSGAAFIKSGKAVYDHSEYKMELPGSLEPIPANSPVQLRRAGTADIGALAKLDSLCFNLPEEETKLFYSDNNLFTVHGDGEDNDIQVYFVVLDGNDIGMLRLHKENDEVMIYGFGIKPEYRGKGYGRASLARAVNTALSYRPAKVGLEVDCINDTALSLYFSCGFRTTATYDYYRLML